MLKYYVCKYYLNAQHSFDDCREHAHAHTFTISFAVEEPKDNGNISFSKIDGMITGYLKRLDGRYLNEEPEFRSLNPTIENIADVLYEKIGGKLRTENVTLIQVEICENPLRVYSVSNRILLVSEHTGESGQYWERLLERKKEFVLMTGMKEGGV